MISISSLKKLMILDVSYSRSLTKTGDFFGLDNLEKLILGDCASLEELDNSIGCLHKLAFLDLSGCSSLRMIPWEVICKLSSIQELRLGSLKEHVRLLQFHNLKILHLINCNIQNLPRNITFIKARWCENLVNLPSNMNELTSLTVLDFWGCPKLGSEDPLFLMELRDLTNLSHFKMSNCGVSQVPDEIGNLVSLVTMDLSENTFCTLPDSLSNLSQLVSLNVDRCSELRSLPLLPSNLVRISARDCELLNVMAFDWMQRSYIFRSKAFKESSFSKPLLIKIDLDVVQKEEISDWCSHRKKGDILSLETSKHLDKKICGIILYANGWIRDVPKLVNKTKNTSRCLEKLCHISKMRVMFYYPLDETTLVVEAGDTLAIEFAPNEAPRCKLRLIYDCDVMDSKLVLQSVNDGISHDTNGEYEDSEYDRSDDDDVFTL